MGSSGSEMQKTLQGRVSRTQLASRPQQQSKWKRHEGLLKSRKMVAARLKRQIVLSDWSSSRNRRTNRIPNQKSSPSRKGTSLEMNMRTRLHRSQSLALLTLHTLRIHQTSYAKGSTLNSSKRSIITTTRSTSWRQIQPHHRLLSNNKQ